jgi:hypothetical protein
MCTTMATAHDGHIEEVRQFLQRGFSCEQVNHVTDTDTDFAFDYDGISRRITVARTFFDSLTTGDIAGVLERWKLAEKVVTAQGKTVYVGEDGVSILE